MRFELHVFGKLKSGQFIVAFLNRMPRLRCVTCGRQMLPTDSTCVHCKASAASTQETPVAPHAGRGLKRDAGKRQRRGEQVASRARKSDGSKRLSTDRGMSTFLFARWPD